MCRRRPMPHLRALAPVFRGETAPACKVARLDRAWLQPRARRGRRYWLPFARAIARTARRSARTEPRRALKQKMPEPWNLSKKNFRPFLSDELKLAVEN